MESLGPLKHDPSGLPVHKGISNLSDISSLCQKIKFKNAIFFLCGNIKFQLSFFLNNNSLLPSEILGNGGG